MNTLHNGSPLKFFFLVFALSLPFWFAGALTTVQLLPSLPMSSLMFFCPVTAALILVYKKNKTNGVTELLKRSFDYKRIRAKIWYVPIILLMPGIMVFSYGQMRLMGMAIPTPQFTILAALTLFLAFFIAALCEELGWTGYAIDPMQDRWNALQASILLGLLWAAWHIVPYLQAHRTLTWIAWQCLFTITGRVILVWLYNNTGKSVFATAVCHAMANVSVFLFPIYGSYYDPHIASLITTFVAVLVTVLWGPQTLARDRTP
jgi:membrane protease YdiL (CAAX protease family)